MDLVCLPLVVDTATKVGMITGQSPLTGRNTSASPLRSKQTISARKEEELESHASKGPEVSYVLVCSLDGAVQPETGEEASCGSQHSTAISRVSRLCLLHHAVIAVLFAVVLCLLVEHVQPAWNRVRCLDRRQPQKIRARRKKEAQDRFKHARMSCEWRGAAVDSGYHHADCSACPIPILQSDVSGREIRRNGE